MFDVLPTAKHHWIYSMIALQVPKTASSSINSVLKERNLLEKHKDLLTQKFGRHPLYRGVFDTRHLIPSHIFACFGEKIRGFFSFAVVREPADRLKSAFHFGKENNLWKVYGLDPNITPDLFISWLWANRKKSDILILLPQSTWAKSEILPNTRVLKFENLNQSWNKMLIDNKIDGLPLELPHLNKSSNKGEQIFSAESIQKIGEIYQKDYELLDYRLTGC